MFADRPLAVGDYFRSGEYEGTVEEIGLRSIRFRPLDRTVIGIPNGQFPNFPVENYASRDQRLLRTTLCVRYETSRHQLRSLLADATGKTKGSAGRRAVLLPARLGWCLDQISHTHPLDDINHVFDLMHVDESVRSVVLY